LDVDVLDFEGVSVRDVLPDLDLTVSSFFDRRLDEDLLTSVRILIFVFFALAFSVSFSSSLTTLPFREDSWSSPVSGGLGGAWWFSVRWFVFSSSRSVKSVGSGVGILALRTSSLLWALEKLGYGKLDLDSRNEAVPDRLSRPGMEDRRREERAVSESRPLVDGRVRPFFVVVVFFLSSRFSLTGNMADSKLCSGSFVPLVRGRLPLPWHEGNLAIFVNALKPCGSDWFRVL
jgi:hypothetical protein